MTDELTPEEQEALRSLPRERMPVGLEGRVVEAMRERGFFARRRRTIVVTNGRVAGVLAAGVALMIGAYSIGLHRGDGNAVIPPMRATQEEEAARKDQAPPLPEEQKAGQPPADEAREAGRPDVTAADPRRTPESEAKKVETPAVAPARSEEARADRAPQPESVMEGMASRQRDTAAAPAQSTPAPPTVSEQSVGRLQARGGRGGEVGVAPRQTLTFLLDGMPMTVEADSVRVTEDERGRMLLIYTPDGVFRIRLAD
jgi:hypothetical protein